MGSVSSGVWLASLVWCGVYAPTGAETSLLVLAAGSGTGLVTWSQEPRHCSGIWQLAHHWSKGTVSIWWLWVLCGKSSAPHILLPTTLPHRLNILLKLPSVPTHKSHSSVKAENYVAFLYSYTCTLPWFCFDGRARIWVSSPAYTIGHLVWFDRPGRKTYLVMTYKNEAILCIALHGSILPATVRFNVVISVFFLATLLACLLPLLVPATLSLSWQKHYEMGKIMIFTNCLSFPCLQGYLQIIGKDSIMTLTIPIFCNSSKLDHHKNKNK